jgi:uncharacterized protein (DUF2235 family)
MAKNIALFSDGTGNGSSQLLKTNVWRTHLATDLTSVSQIACYDDGVGTSTIKPLALLGGAFGWGLKRNVLQLYTYLCRQYEPGDRIYGFGFSRGAFTMRLLVGFVAHMGLVSFKSEEELQRNARAAYRAYRKYCSNSSELGTPWLAKLGRWVRDGVLCAWNGFKGYPSIDQVPRREVKSIRFLGLWDTVAAYGMPIDELKQAIDRHVWPLSFPDNKLSPKVERACHALALDDERRSFHPVLWDERSEQPRRGDTIDGERISQVWFAGMHSNVGGGYAEDGLAHVALIWIMCEAAKAGLSFSKAIAVPMRRAEATTGKLYDSRGGLGAYYRYMPRRADIGPGGTTIRPKVHDSVLARINMAIGGYAPISLPDSFDMVTPQGKIVPTQASRGNENDLEAAEMIADMIWLKRLFYLLQFAITTILVLSPKLSWSSYENLDLLARAEAGLGAVLRLPIEVLAMSLPGFVSPWIDTFRAHPLAFLGLVAIGVSFWRWSSRLEDWIADTSRYRWSNGTGGAVPPRSIATSLARSLRNMAWLVAAYRWVTARFIPWLIAMAMLLSIPYGINRLVSSVLQAAGTVCAASPTTLPAGAETTVILTTTEPCQATGIQLEQGKRYRIEASPSGALFDDKIPVSGGARGFGALDAAVPYLTRPIMLAAVPMRRHLFEQYFVPIARIGALGREENALGEPVTIEPIETGELFLFVNDAVLLHPAVLKEIYRNNGGSFTIKLRRIE